ncbi:hypothetical protein Z949_16 [Sulfitobacter guttiformis KCTC 32187]|nr:hypothetical protein Z949_16 [Sulfitobacter guttiformis KCTC 32187]
MLRTPVPFHLWRLKDCVPRLPRSAQVCRTNLGDNAQPIEAPRGCWLPARIIPQSAGQAR